MMRHIYFHLLKKTQRFSIVSGLILFTLTAFASASGDTAHDNHSYFDQQRGKRLFHGLATPASGEVVNCASCHNVYYIDTLNWNPSAMEIAVRSNKMDTLQMTAKIMSPVTKKLTEAHKNISLNTEEVKLIQLYLAELTESGETKKRPHVTRLIIFFIAFLIFGWAITDLLIIKRVEKTYILTIILLVTTIYMIDVLVTEGIRVGRSQDYQPLQPIKFSHKVHATDNQIDCQYCHHTAEDSKSAGIPAASLCLNCHSIVREGTHSGRFEIDKIHTAIDSMHPIEWVRVHQLPDFVYFNHSQHVTAGNVSCMECHGAIEEMDVVKQENDLSMGWCLDCHRTKKVDFTNNDYYGMTFTDFHEQIKNGELDSVTVADIGGDNCMKCHY